MAGIIRQDRVAESIKRFISTMVYTDFAGTPADMITITRVSVLQDLRAAKIYYSTFNPENVEKIQEYLDSNLKNIRFKLAAHLSRLKFVPEIKFVYDDSIEREIRLEKIFEAIKND